MDAVKLIQPAQGLNLVGMLKTAQLALKHREKKNSKQKVVLFVGSPVKNTPAELAKLAKLLKKNGVGVDVVNFGAENQTNDNCDKLSTFVKKVRSRDNSRFVNVPPQASLPDYVFNICVTEGSVEEAEGAAAPVDAGAAAPSGGAGQFAEYGGVDPNLDPELAMAIRMSMEEANAAAASASAAETGDNEVGGGDADADADAMQDDNVPAPEAQQQPSEPNFDSMTEDQMMAYAIQMSLADDNKYTQMLSPCQTDQSLFWCAYVALRWFLTVCPTVCPSLRPLNNHPSSGSNKRNHSSSSNSSNNNNRRRLHRTSNCARICKILRS
ncbi:MAG: hypothetical protein MHM6MM_005759 [Cercozoa sp. M6MM]